MARKFGEGDTAIAAYVRAHHPEIVERVVAVQRERKQEAVRKMRGKLLENHAARKQVKASKLIAELTALGVNVAVVNPITTVGPYTLNGARFYTPAT
jgi:hypothetical protein